MLYSNRDAQISKGREALLFFHNASVGYQNYKLSFDELLNKVSNNKPTVFLEGFGLAIESLDEGGFFSFSGNKVKNSMEALAEKAQGRIPVNRNDFFSALRDEAMNYSFKDAAGFVAVESSKEVVKGAQAVGDTLITTLKGLGILFPIIVIGGIAFISYSKIRKAA